MKKIFVTFFSISLLAFIVFLFSGCGAEIDNYREYLSDIRYGVFDGQCESYNVTFTYGLREKPYSPNGIASPKVEFGIISVLFDEKIEDDDIAYYSLKINNDIVAGKLEKSPYTNQYMADIGSICSDTDILTLEIYLASDTNSKSTTLINKNLDWNINYEDAFINGVTALSEEINDFLKNNLTYEIQVKIINEQQTNFGSYFWSVTIISSSGIKHNVVFRVDSTDILVKN